MNVTAPNFRQDRQELIENYLLSLQYEIHKGIE